MSNMFIKNSNSEDLFLKYLNSKEGEEVVLKILRGEK